MLEDPREATIPFNPFVCRSWSDVQLLNYSKSCGGNFPVSPNHKLRCLEMIHKIETSKASRVASNAETFEVHQQVILLHTLKSYSGMLEINSILLKIFFISSKVDVFCIQESKFEELHHSL